MWLAAQILVAVAATWGSTKFGSTVGCAGHSPRLWCTTLLRWWTRLLTLHSIIDLVHNFIVLVNFLLSLLFNIIQSSGVWFWQAGLWCANDLIILALKDFYLDFDAVVVTQNFQRLKRCSSLMPFFTGPWNQGVLYSWVLLWSGVEAGECFFAEPAAMKTLWINCCSGAQAFLLRWPTVATNLDCSSFALIWCWQAGERHLRWSQLFALRAGRSTSGASHQPPQYSIPNNTKVQLHAKTERINLHLPDIGKFSSQERS